MVLSNGQLIHSCRYSPTSLDHQSGRPSKDANVRNSPRRLRVLDLRIMRMMRMMRMIAQPGISGRSSVIPLCQRHFTRRVINSIGPIGCKLKAGRYPVDMIQWFHCGNDAVNMTQLIWSSGYVLVNSLWICSNGYVLVNSQWIWSSGSPANGIQLLFESNYEFADELQGFLDDSLSEWFCIFPWFNFNELKFSHSSGMELY